MWNTKKGVVMGSSPKVKKSVYDDYRKGFSGVIYFRETPFVFNSKKELKSIRETIKEMRVSNEYRLAA
jgi:hypothetical protein